MSDGREEREEQEVRRELERRENLKKQYDQLDPHAGLTPDDPWQPEREDS